MWAKFKTFWIHVDVDVDWLNVYKINFQGISADYLSSNHLKVLNMYHVTSLNVWVNRSR